MSHNLTVPIAYMENNDFDANGNLINPLVPNNVPVVIMAQSEVCHHCIVAIPDFQQFANKYANKVFCATISSESNSTQQEKDLVARIRQINPNFKGFPDYSLYWNGQRVDKEIKDRSVKGLEDFVG